MGSKVKDIVEVIKVILYYRVSTKSKWQRGSMENQPEFLKKFIERLERENPNVKYEVVAEESDWGLSGTGFLNRDGFTRMLTDYCGLKVDKIEFDKVEHPTIEGALMKQKKYIVSADPKKQPLVKYIFTKSCSRFARNLNAIDIIKTLRLKGVYLYVADIRQSSETKEGLQAIIDEITRAENYSSALSVTMSIAKEQMAENNEVQGCPTGYIRHNKVIHKDDSIEPAYYEIHPTKGKGITLAYELCHAGYGAKRVSTILARDYGIYADDKTKKPLATSTIYRIWSNPKYKGVNVVNRWETGALWEKLSSAKENKNYETKESEFIPPLVSEELWDAVQEDVKNRRNKKKGNGSFTPQHPYKEKLRCRYCGNSFVFSKENDEKGDNSHFRCSTKRNQGVAACNCNNLYVHKLDSFIENLSKGDLQWLIRKDAEILINSLLSEIEFYIKILRDPNFVDSPEVKELKKELNTKKERRKRLEQMIVEVGYEGQEKDEKTAELKEYTREIAEIQSRLDKLSLATTEIQTRLSMLFDCIYDEIFSYDGIKKKYKKEEVLEMIDTIEIGGKTINNKGGKSPETVIIPMLKRSNHCMEVLKKCHIERPKVTLVNKIPDYITPDEAEQTGVELDIIDSDALYDDKREMLRKRGTEEFADVELPFVLQNFANDEIMEKAKKNKDYFTLVMGFQPDLGFENLSVIQQTKEYIENLHSEFRELIS